MSQTCLYENEWNVHFGHYNTSLMGWVGLIKMDPCPCLKWHKNVTRASFKYLHGKETPSCLAGKFLRSSDHDARSHLFTESPSSSSLIVRRIYAVVDCRQPSFPSRRCSSLGRTTTPRHVCSVPARFLAVVWRLIFSAVPLSPLFCACEVTFVIIR